jgi:hypothetical protein
MNYYEYFKQKNVYKERFTKCIELITILTY